MTTYGGYVNIAKKDLDFSQPSVLDQVVNDIATQCEKEEDKE